MDEYNSSSLPHPEWNRNFTADQLTDLEKVYVRTRADRIRAAMFPETLLGIAQQQGEEIVQFVQKFLSDLNFVQKRPNKFNFYQPKTKILNALYLLLNTSKVTKPQWVALQNQRKC